MATVGQQLKAPEVGWKRYDDNDPCMSYEGSWEVYTDGNPYGGTYHRTSAVNDSANFNFVGTKLRIISFLWSTHSKSIQIFVDGIQQADFSEYTTANLAQCIVCEITDLNNQEHFVQIINKAVGAMGRASIDAIDIDESGELLPYNPDPVDPTDPELHIVLEVGEQIQLIGNILPEKIGDPNLDWQSVSPNIASVDSSGKVTANAEGVTRIQVKTIDGTWTDYALVEVVAKEEGDQYRLSILLKIGESCLLKFAESSEVIWQSGDPAVATVEPSDKPITRVTAQAKGLALVTVQTADGSKQDQIYVTVIE